MLAMWDCGHPSFEQCHLLFVLNLLPNWKLSSAISELTCHWNCWLPSKIFFCCILFRGPRLKIFFEYLQNVCLLLHYDYDMTLKNMKIIIVTKIYLPKTKCNFAFLLCLNLYRRQQIMCSPCLRKTAKMSCGDWRLKQLNVKFIVQSAAEFFTRRRFDPAAGARWQGMSEAINYWPPGTFVTSWSTRSNCTLFQGEHYAMWYFAQNIGN